MSSMIEASQKYKRYIAPAVRFLYNKSDKIVSVSKEMENDLVTNFGIDRKNIETIYNGYDIRRIESSIKKEYKDIGVFEIVTMGRLEMQKGQWHLVKAFSKFHENIHNLDLK